MKIQLRSNEGEKVFELPQKPGVYIFKDEKGKRLYIGKAINIAKRVKGHFAKAKLDIKSDAFTSRLDSIEPIVVDSEIEALVLEANLIKKYKPPYNSQLKDGKDYLYIKITNDKFPRVITARKRDLENSLYYFGPFPSSAKVRSTLKLLRRVFPYSTCKPGQKRPCLFFHLGLCSGVCAGKISEKDYKKNIRNLRLFLEGKKFEVLGNLERQMKILSKRQSYEEAAETKKKMESISYITRPVRLVEEYIEEDLASLRRKEIEELTRVLGFSKSPTRIECYDISNFLGSYSVGSMVVFVNGESDRSEYRRFKIKRVKGINDPAMMAEVLSRRFQNSWQTPDLLIVDGGKTQLNASLAVLKGLGLNIPLVSLAKRLEEIHVPGRETTIRLERKSDALKLVQRIRDEAHRFAVTYHRKLRSMEFLTK